jgi:hypothetical protein
VGETAKEEAIPTTKKDFTERVFNPSLFEKDQEIAEAESDGEESKFPAEMYGESFHKVFEEELFQLSKMELKIPSEGTMESGDSLK